MAYRNAALLSLEAGRVVIAVSFDAQHGSMDVVAWTAHSVLAASLAHSVCPNGFTLTWHVVL